MQHRKRHAQADKAEQHGSPNSGTRSSQLPDDQDDNADNELRDDDDEETLQLKLAAIEARLKLKRLQQNKARPQSSASETKPENTSPYKLHPTQRSAPGHVPRSGTSPSRKLAPEQEDVQVLVSPSKRPERAPDPTSPKRVMLGIDKGVRGSDVSLKWRSSAPKESLFTSKRTDGSAGRDGGRSGRTAQSTSSPNKPTSFTDRVLEQRSTDKAKREKAQNMQIKRNSRFAVDRKEIENYHAAASAADAGGRQTHTPVNDRRPVQEFSRNDVMSAYHRPNSSSSRYNNPVNERTNNKYPDLSSGSDSRHAHRNQTHNSAHSRPGVPQDSSNANDEAGQPSDQKAPDPSKFEAYSGLHLSKRILPYSFLKRTFAEATPMRIPDILKTVKPPSFDPPETDGDYVVFGIVASKSSPRNHKEKHNATPKENDPVDEAYNNTSKYMVLSLTDLKWSIDLFLFATAFPRYYKLTPGTLIAILNPSIMPPPPHKVDTNAFSLTVSSSDDTILEIGTANDIGFCKSVKKDGQVCGSWVDARKTEFCDFHVELQLKRTKAGRMGVNSGSGILGDRGGGTGGRGGKYGGRGRGGGNEDGLKNEGGAYDRASGSMYYVVPSTARGTNSHNFGHRSAAGLIDADDPFVSPSGLNRGAENKEERFRKRVAEQQREREIAKRLGEFKGVGSEYLRACHSQTSTTETSSSVTAGRHDNRNSGTNTDCQNDAQRNQGDPELAGGLGNLSRSASDVKLGRSKKRTLSPDKNAPRSANAGKKTRFITSKGIREAGRDSLGDTTLTLAGHNNDDDDDDLDIV